jgi:nicotinate-nucleotide--dimethylbenzimidazole phosphoribosyltransferase
VTLDPLSDVLSRIERAPDLEPTSADAPPVRDELARLLLWWRTLGRGHIPLAASPQPTEAGIVAGIAALDGAVDQGATLLIAHLDEEDDLAARTAIAVLCHRDAATVTHQPLGMSDAEWAARCARTRDEIARNLALRGDPIALLDSLHDPAMTSMVGVLLAASARRTPALLEGTRVWAAAVVADRIAPAASTWWRAASSSIDPAHRAAMERIDVCRGLPLDIDASAGDGARAALALLNAFAKE